MAIAIGSVLAVATEGLPAAGADVDKGKNPFRITEVSQ